MKNEIKKLSLEQCRKVFHNSAQNYSDAQILEIRDFLYNLAAIEYEILMKVENSVLSLEEETSFKQAA
jgi:hypothetical protein